MDSKICLGIDPGISGGLSFLNLDSGELTPYRMPVDKSGKRTELDICEIIRLIRLHKPCRANLEAVHAMPRDGGVGAFAFGKGFGILLGILATLEVPVRLIPPQTWKKHYDLIKADKEKSRELASRLFPSNVDSWRFKRDDGVAESALIARYGNE